MNAEDSSQNNLSSHRHTMNQGLDLQNCLTIHLTIRFNLRIIVQCKGQLR